MKRATIIISLDINQYSKQTCYNISNLNNKKMLLEIKILDAYLLLLDIYNIRMQFKDLKGYRRVYENKNNRYKKLKKIFELT